MLESIFFACVCNVTCLCISGSLTSATEVHSVHVKKLPYDERYTSFIEKLGLLPYINLVTRSTPNMNPPAITALVDRWRPETHTFHLRTGEMAVTLQDMSMILGLPIKGVPVCFNTNSDLYLDQGAIQGPSTPGCIQGGD
jgi:hypothetical protein